MKMQKQEDSSVDDTKIKAVFVGLFMSIFSGVLLFFTLRSIGMEGTPFPEELVWMFPIAVGAALGVYAAKFSLWASESQDTSKSE